MRTFPLVALANVSEFMILYEKKSTLTTSLLVLCSDGVPIILAVVGHPGQQF